MIRKKLALGAKILAVFFILFLSTGCDSHHFRMHSGNGGDAGGEDVDGHDGSGTVDHEGGTVDVNDGDSPINGVRVVVPPGAVDEGKTVTIYIDRMNGLPGPAGPDVTPLSDGVSITKDDPDKFNIPVYVYIPYDPDLMGEGDIPGAFYWDETAHKYVALGVKEIDLVNHVVCFTTVQLGQYVILTVKGLSSALPAADSGFTACEDGFFHPDFGSYDYPGSSSFGMAGFSEWYYSLQKGPEGDGLYGMHRVGDPARWEDDVTARELVSRAYADAAYIWSFLWAEPDYRLDDALTGRLLILALTVTGSPQAMVLSGDSFGHTVTVTGYDREAGVFTLYDSNFPCETPTLEWDPVTGFANYSKAAAYPEITQYSFDSYLTAYGTDELRALYAGAQSGWDETKFQTVHILSPALDEDGSAMVPDRRNVTVTGTVTGGLEKAAYLVYNVNGVDGLGGQLVDIAPDGSFSFTIPELPRAVNSIMVMTSADPGDAARRVPGAYAGFEEFTIEVVGWSHFFVNPGFETGDFTGWGHETRYLCSLKPAACERNTIKTPGTDPIFNSFQKVAFGNYSARVNDISGGGHFSSVWQTAVVPANVPFPEIRFSWSAVFEDTDWCFATGGHSSVEILVYDETAGVPLYHETFRPDDTTFSGWQDLTPLWKNAFKQWKGIPWQVVVVDCSAVKGHALTLKVTAADCSRTAHGGYLYLDAEE